MAQLRDVLGPVTDTKLEIVVSLVTSFTGRQGGRPPKPKPLSKHQIDAAKTPLVRGYVTPLGGGGGQGSDPSPSPGSDPDLPDLSKPIRKRLHTMMSPEGFADFWVLYPRRVGKQTAIAAWKHINPSINLKVSLMSALAWQVTNIFAHRELEKIPHPATWLNGRRWEDEQQESLVLPNGHPPAAPARNFREEVTAAAFATARASRKGLLP